MSSIPHLTDAVETLLRASDDPLPRAARQRLALFVVGVLLAGTVVLRRVATTRTPIALGAAQAASHERRLRRIVHDPQLGRRRRCPGGLCAGCCSGCVPTSGSG